MKDRIPLKAVTSQDATARINGVQTRISEGKAEAGRHSVPTIESFARHGGRLTTAQLLFPCAPLPWIDLSTGINPKPYPAPRASITERNRLPGVRQLQKLEAIAANAFGVEDVARVVAVGGTETALRLLPYLLKCRRAVIAGPTYSSHSDAWKRCGAETLESTDSEIEAKIATPDTALTVVNPNNPDGRVVSRERLQALHESLQAHGGFLIADESFAEVAPQASVAALAGGDAAPNLVVLRSFGKFYGLAGVRLGFVIASRAIGAVLRGALGDWPVSSDGLVAGIAAYADSRWAGQTRERLQADADRLDALLVRGGFAIAGGTSLYRLARISDAADWFTRLARAGILVRPFAHDATLLRFGLPANPFAWQRVADTLMDRA